MIHTVQPFKIRIWKLIQRTALFCFQFRLKCDFLVEFVAWFFEIVSFKGSSKLLRKYIVLHTWIYLVYLPSTRIETEHVA